MQRVFGRDVKTDNVTAKMTGQHQGQHTFDTVQSLKKKCVDTYTVQIILHFIDCSLCACMDAQQNPTFL